MRLTANLMLLAVALLAGCCSSNHCGQTDGCCQPACGAPGYYAGGTIMPTPVPDVPPMEPAEEAPEPPVE